MTDAELAADLAKQAGRLLLDLRDSGRFSGKGLGEEGDRLANALLVSELRRARPDDALLSEEEKDNHARLGKTRAWIVDPVDGTREYGEGRTDWAVHVALTIDGAPAIGAVALPALGLVLRSDQPIALSPPPARLRMLVSRTRPAREAVAVAEALGAADIYLHSGGQYEWDSCAPVAVALAHGLHCSRIDGTALIYNQRDTYVPDLLICHRDHAEDVLALVRQVPAAD
jgi:3'(2'), 5'-bisphosphate nucleotidase